MKNRIKQIRKEWKLTQVEFGERIGVKGNTITNYENGLRNPTDAVVLSICREFGINETWLRTGDGKMKLDIDKENQLMMWAGNVLKDESESFKRRFINMLMELDESEWEFLEKIAIKLRDEKG